MASLICWSSGLLEVVVTGKVPNGVVVLATGQDARLRSAVLGSKHVEYVDALRGSYITAVRAAVEAGEGEDALMELVVAFQGVLTRNLKDPKRRMK